MKYEDYLANIYYDPNYPGAYGGVEKLYRAVRKEGKYVIGRTKIRNWLLKQEDYAVHRETRSKFKRRRVVAPFVDYQWDVDTANMTFYKKENDGNAFFVLAIDILSKFIWTVPLRTTTGQEMVLALKRMFAAGRKPTHLRSDQGTEFVNRNVKALLKKEGVTFFVTHNVVKASYAERAIKTIKSRLVRYMTHKQTHRWIDILPKVTESYNQTYHRSIKRSPQSVKPTDSVELWKRQYDTIPMSNSNRRHVSAVAKFKYKVGDLVRVSFLRRPFQREYDERWSRELFVVNQRFMSDNIPQYFLKDYAGELVSGTFYSNQLKKAHEQTNYLVEKVLRHRTRRGQKELLVRWRGWPAKYDSWISAEDVSALNTSDSETAAS